MVASMPALRSPGGDGFLFWLLEAFFEPTGENAQADQHEHGEQGGPGGDEIAVPLDRVGRRFPGVIRDEADARRPDDSTERVPEEELPPVHPADAGDPGGGEAEDGDEAAEEHRLRPMAFHDA